MALSDVLVNVGIVPFDGTGDKGQVPFSKYNAAVSYLYPAVGTLQTSLAALPDLSGYSTVSSNASTALTKVNALPDLTGYSTVVSNATAGAAAAANASSALAKANTSLVSAGTRRLALSNFTDSGSGKSIIPIVDQTGCTTANDSYTAFVAALAYVRTQRLGGTNYTLYVDCSIFLNIYNDYTKAIFIEPYSNIDFSPGSVIYFNTMGFPTFTLAYASYVRVNNWNSQYVAGSGSDARVNQGTPIDVQVTPTSPSGQTWKGITNRYNDITLTNYMKPVSSGGTCPDDRIHVTMTGVNALTPGIVPYYTTIAFIGDSHDIHFDNAYFGCPQGANAAMFCPGGYFGGSNWKQNTSVTGASAQDVASTCRTPYNIFFTNVTFDGVYFGAQGSGAGISIEGGTWIRYSDLQNYDGSQVAGWGGQIPYNATANYSVGCVITQAGTAYQCINPNGPLTTVAAPPNATYWATYSATTTGYPTSTPWFSPPHAMYCQDPDHSYFVENPIFVTRKLRNLTDLGVAVGFSQGRRYNSQLYSFKLSAANYTVVQNVTSYRQDGGMSLVVYNPLNGFGLVEGVYISFVSTITTIQDQAWQGVTTTAGLSFPSANPYVFMVLNNFTIIDNASTSTVCPLGNGLSNINNVNCKFRNFSIYMNDFSGSNYMGTAFAGTNMDIEIDYYLASYTATTTFRGVMNQSSAVLQQSKLKYNVYGFRSPPIVFTAAPTGLGGTNVLAANWAQTTGTYPVNFSEGSVRYVTLTNGTQNATWQKALPGTAFTFSSAPVSGTTATLSAGGITALGDGNYDITVTNSNSTTSTYLVSITNGAVTSTTTFNALSTVNGIVTLTLGTAAPTTTAFVQGLVAADYGNKKNRISLIGTGDSSLGNTTAQNITNRIEIFDDTNQVLQICENGVQRERIAQFWKGSPTRGATTFTIPNIFWNGNQSLVAASYLISSTGALGASGGLTGVTISANGASPPTISGQNTLAQVYPFPTNGTTLPITASGSAASPEFAPVYSGPSAPTRQLVLTALGGTFDGTGEIIISATFAGNVATL